MKPFNLETVLKYRQRLKDQAQSRFQSAQRKLAEARESLAEKQGEYQHLLNTFKKLETDGIAVDDHIRYQNRLEFVSAELEECEKEVQKKREVVILERKQLLHTSQDERVLGKLKEKQNLEYRRYVNRKETAILDEIAVLHKKQ